MQHVTMIEAYTTHYYAAVCACVCVCVCVCALVCVYVCVYAHALLNTTIKEEGRV